MGLCGLKLRLPIPKVQWPKTIQMQKSPTHMENYSSNFTNVHKGRKGQLSLAGFLHKLSFIHYIS